MSNNLVKGIENVAICSQTMPFLYNYDSQLYKKGHD